ncbi:hypothetical protein ACLNGM_09505 [Aureimonas phyllosphaerae]|uniref:hypothetical protein n=1 Tax=Aureimonas phyllosphaerae TaxID=1166078 RepID=UPI003A5BC416
MSEPGLSEAARRELLPTGRLRLGVNVANAEMASERSPGTFEGKAIDLARRLEADWRIAVEIVPFAPGGAILDDMAAWDAAILAVEPSRLDRLHFLPAFATVDATLATLTHPSIARCGDADADGVRIAVVRGAAYTAHLEHTFAHGELVAFDSPKAARAAMLSGDCQFVAGIRSTLKVFAHEHPDVRLMEDDILRVPQALAIPLGRPHAQAVLEAWFQGTGIEAAAS